MLALGAGLIGASLGRAGADRAGTIWSGGTFRIATTSGTYTVDPALVFFSSYLQLADASCALLLNYPDKEPPAGLRLVPEVAAGYPRVANGGREYIFTIRRGFRFSNGRRVTVQSFLRAFTRVLAPSMQSYAATFLEDVVGAKDVKEGSLPAGISGRGNRLVIRLTRPVPDLLARLAAPVFCAVPSNLPIDPEGVGAPLPSAGPYYIAEYVPGRRVVLRRNRFYGGKRPRHVNAFVVELNVPTSEDVIEKVKNGTADWSAEPEQAYFRQASDLRRRRSRFFRRPGPYLLGFYLNSKRPLFRSNARLRRAVNFAIDRPALIHEFGGSLSGQATDQYLPPSLPGFRDAAIYPLRHPGVAKARALARRHLRSRKAVLYVRDEPSYIVQAQIVKRDLAAIGLRVDIKTWPASLYYTKVYEPGEPWDIAQAGWFPDFVDPYTYLNELFAGTSVHNPAFDSPKYNRLLARVARLQGDVRYRAYGTLDVDLARNAAPFVAVFYANIPTFVSKRVSCIVLRPYLDVAAACLKR
jgi:peptide/nickel transport system substrate-binding protein